jgi:hypothetical protein
MRPGCPRHDPAERRRPRSYRAALQNADTFTRAALAWLQKASRDA